MYGDCLNKEKFNIIDYEKIRSVCKTLHSVTEI